MSEFERQTLLMGEEAMKKLQNSRIAVFGIGGVGAACAEALARAGVGDITLIDDDTVSESNINRQFLALHSTIGQWKADCMAARILDICPRTAVHPVRMFYNEETSPSLPLDFDYIADCIDTVSSKTLLILSAHAQNTPIISALGTGNKLDPTKLEVADIFDTSVCPLARVMRKQLKDAGLNRHRVVYSRETPRKLAVQPLENGRHIPGSVSFVPPVAGYIMASQIVLFLTAPYLS